MSQPYLSLEAELHDAFWEAEDDGSEVRLMAEFLKKFPGPALEVGSGSGRLMFPLLRMGFEVEGLELSADMLALGNVRAEKLGVNPVVHAGDMTSWRGGRRYASLLAPAFTLQLSRKSRRDTAALARTFGEPWWDLSDSVHALCRAVGRSAGEPMVSGPSGHAGRRSREGQLETRHRLDRKRQLLHREHRYSLSGDPPVSHESSQTIRWIEHTEMLALLENTGFRLNRFFLDFDPGQTTGDPDHADFDGILTYQATRADGKT